MPRSALRHKRGRSNDARYQVTPMKRQIAIGLGLSIVAASQPALVFQPRETLGWIGLSGLSISPRSASVAIPSVPEVQFDIDEIVRQVRDHIDLLQAGFGVEQPSEVTIELRCERVVELELLRGRDQVFAFATPRCPDRPEIPSWAWAWELSTPEGW
jgi:hypothetical protein